MICPSQTGCIINRNDDRNHKVNADEVFSILLQKDRGHEGSQSYPHQALIAYVSRIDRMHQGPTSANVYAM